MSYTSPELLRRLELSLLTPLKESAISWYKVCFGSAPSLLFTSAYSQSIAEFDSQVATLLTAMEPGRSQYMERSSRWVSFHLAYSSVTDCALEGVSGRWAGMQPLNCAHSFRYQKYSHAV